MGLPVFLDSSRARFSCSESRASARRLSKRERSAGSTSLQDRKSTRLNSSHANISYAVFCLKKQHYFPPIFFPFRFPSHFFLLYSKPSSFPSFITTFSLFFFPFFLFPHPLHVMFYIPIIISY